MKSTVAGVSILAFFLGLAALNGCMTSAESRPQANGAGQQPDDLIDGDLSAPADGDTASLAKDLRWLKERTAELAAVAERLRPQLTAKSNELQTIRRLAPLGSRTVNKRHCWDVADVCCMWNIC